MSRHFFCSWSMTITSGLLALISFDSVCTSDLVPERVPSCEMSFGIFASYSVYIFPSRNVFVPEWSHPCHGMAWKFHAVIKKIANIYESTIFSLPFGCQRLFLVQFPVPLELRPNKPQKMFNLFLRQSYPHLYRAVFSCMRLTRFHLGQDWSTLSWARWTGPGRNICPCRQKVNFQRDAAY